MQKHISLASYNDLVSKRYGQTAKNFGLSLELICKLFSYKVDWIPLNIDDLDVDELTASDVLSIFDIDSLKITTTHYIVTFESFKIDRVFIVDTGFELLQLIEKYEDYCGENLYFLQPMDYIIFDICSDEFTLIHHDGYRTKLNLSKFRVF